MTRQAKALTMVASLTEASGMSFDSVPRNVISANLLAQFAVTQGMELDACLHDTGIAPAMLANARTEITAQQELMLVRNVVARLGHIPGIGLTVGLRYHLSIYGIWGFALVSSPTYRSAADIAIRYLDLSYAFVRFRLEPRDNGLAVLLDDTAIPADVRQFLLERDFAAWSNAIREMRPDGLAVRSAQFSFPRPAYADRFTELCGVEPRFSASDNSIVHDASTLDAPLPQGDGNLARLCLEQCRQLLASRQARTGLAAKVRDHLFHSAHAMPDVNAVAGTLYMSPRTLRRRLEEENTSFRELLDEVRQVLAEEMLSTGRIKLSEIALRLGYAEPASFIHAFKRWKGVSPTAFREQQSDETVQ